MGTTYENILDLLTNNPGNILYHVMIALTIFGALQSSINLWREDILPHIRRAVLGLSLLLTVRFLLFISAGAVELGLTSAHLLLPNADRCVMIVSLVIIIWLWAFPDPAHLADAVSSFLVLSVITIFFISQLWWHTQPLEIAFNNTFLNSGWELVAIVILILGIILVVTRRIDGWGYGLAMLTLLFIGHLAQFLKPDIESDYPGAVRLLELAAFPLLWSISNQITLKFTKGIKEKGANTDLSTGINLVRTNAFQSILLLTDKSSPFTTYQRINKLLAEAFNADFNFVFLPPDSNGLITIPSGYDLIRDSFRSTLSIDSEKIPSLVTAMKRLRPIRISATSSSLDTSNIAKTFNLAQTGHILAAFIPTIDGTKASLGIVLLSPHSGHQWSRDDQAMLNKIAVSLGTILESRKQIDVLTSELDKTNKKLHTVENTLNKITHQNQERTSEDVNGFENIRFEDKTST